jgi:ATP-dependent Lon protease
MENRPRATRRSRRLRATATAFQPVNLLDAYEGDCAVQNAPESCELPVLPVRNTVLLPNMVVPLFVDREAALNAVDAAMEDEQLILIVAQRDEQVVDPTYRDVYSVGTECAITRLLRMPDGSTSIMVQGLRRVRIDDWLQHTPYGRIHGTAFLEVTETTARVEALMRAALTAFEHCVKLNGRLTEDAYIQALNVHQPGALADFLVGQIEPPLDVRQQLLETIDVAERLKHVCQLLNRELSVLELEQHIHEEVQSEAEQGQREYLLREQLKVIQKELGESDPAQSELQELKTKIEACGLPAEAHARALKELGRLHTMPAMSPEYGVISTYLDWLVSLPWHERTADHLDLRAVAQALDARHFGLEKVKDRIIEFLAVRKLAPQGRAPILCLVGPPGVGKTSLGRTVAEALGRQFVRVSLGGVRDEAEIRGHRRTYVGALPGRMLQAMKTAGTINPVFVLDEVDKLASDYRGDPSAALLEVLDPEQNCAFSDHYLEVPYDLSQVFFIVTANVLHTIPAPLRDRMEIVEIAGYTGEEKLHIAREYLLPRLMADSGLNEARAELDDGALHRVIREYTFEAGVRGLEREIAAILRRVARRVAEGRRHKACITAAKVPAYLGPQKHFPTEAEEHDEIGVATGLAWTAAGGDLTTVEVMAVPGHGTLMLTGQVGDVMRESAQAALTFARARAAQLGLPEGFHESRDLHVHLPAGAIPKDGPSAGITMAVAMISALTDRPVRRDVALTGEITLRGRVLPVGGVKEKVHAAHRAGITTIVLPRRNLKDLDELPDEIHDALTFVAVEAMDDVLKVALVPASAHTQYAAPAPVSHPIRGATARSVAAPLASIPQAERVARQARSRRAEVVARKRQPSLPLATAVTTTATV